MVRAYFGLGSNIGDRWANLRLALSVLAEVDRGVVCSPVYETEPFGGPAGQGRYLNCVARIATTSEPGELLVVAQRAEQRAGRVRTVRFGPRTLDVDVLLVEGVRSDDADLTIPHPRLYERAFVLAPLEDLDPTLVPPDWRSSLDDSGIRRVGALLGPFSSREALAEPRPEAVPR
jgi:2-amino-4-hydroxy-6-hydroxymethyldihydropteridine diphosphokinase